MILSSEMTLSIIAASCAVNVVVLCLTVNQYWFVGENNKIKTSSLIRNLTLIGTVSSIILNILDWIHNYLGLIDDIGLLSPDYALIISLADAFYHLSLLILYTLVLYRTYIIFERTLYALSKSLLIFYIILMIFSLLAMTIWSLIFVVEIDSLANKIYTIIGTVSAIIFTNDLLLNITFEFH